MKKLSILALAAVSLFGFNLYADSQDNLEEEQPIAAATDCSAIENSSSEDNETLSLNEEKKPSEQLLSTEDNGQSTED